MTAEILLFAFFSVLSVASAIGVVAIRDPVKGALSLIGCFFCLGCLFLLQRAELLAALEVLVYAGAIMVLFVFVIMLVENKEQPIVSLALASRLSAPIKVAAVLVVAYSILVLVHRASLSGSAELPEDFGGVRAVGTEFFTSFVFPFELTSVLLLVGIVGAVVVTRRSREKKEGQE